MSRALSILIAGVLLGAILAPRARATQPTPAEYAARCQSGSFPLKSPSEVFQAHNLDITKACPVQSEFDKAHECQDAASTLQSIYDTLKDEHSKTCAAASAAVDKAQQDCLGQDSCLAAQRAALKAYQDAITSELGTLKQYVGQADISMNYAAKNIAGGGVQLLKWIHEDSRRPGDTSAAYGLAGRDGSADWLHATSNEDALTNERLFNKEDPQRANAIVQRFIDNKASPSDLTGIKSPLIREPLEVVQAGREWKQDLMSYQKSLETQSSSLRLQSASLNKDVAVLSNVDSSGKGLSSLTSSSAIPGLTAAAGAAPAIGSALNGASAAGAASAAVAQGAGVGSPTAPAAYPMGSAEFPSAAVGSSRAGGIQAPSGDGTALAQRTPGASPERVTGDGSGAVPQRLAKVATLAVGGNAGASTSGKGGTPANGTSASRPGPGTAGKGKSGDGPAASGPDAASAAAAADTGSGGASPVDRSTSSSPFSADLLGAGALGLPAGTQDSNEKAVKKIVGEWESSLLPNPAGASVGGEGAAASPEILGDESPSLFSRVKVAHLRALQRGSLMRAPSRL